MILKARAEKASSSAARRSPWLSFSRISPDGRDIDGRWQSSITASSIFCTPLFLKAVPHKHWLDLAIDGARTQAKEMSASERSPSQDSGSSDLRMPRRPPRPSARARSSLRLQLRRDLAGIILHALGGLVPVDRLHANQVDDTLELIFGADGNDDRNGLAFRRSFICSTTLKKLAPERSILFTKARRGTPYLFAWRHTVSDCGWTPPTAQ
jgi:hypothetical protein